MIVNAERRCDLVIIFTILIFTICEKKKGLFGGFALADIVGSVFSWICVLCVVQSAAGVFVIFSISLRLDFTSSPQSLELE